MVKSVHARITGRVQGVYYRAWTQENARNRGLSGWVMNCPDGSVEAVFSGPDQAVDDMLAACRDGPADARVDGIETAEAPQPGEGFEIRR